MLCSCQQAQLELRPSITVLGVDCTIPTEDGVAYRGSGPGCTVEIRRSPAYWAVHVRLGPASYCTVGDTLDEAIGQTRNSLLSVINACEERAAAIGGRP
jgi:hypothetical protein